MTTETAAEAKDFSDSPAEWARRWKMEFEAARSEVKAWHAQGDKIVKRFRDERETEKQSDTRWNLFTANIQTVRPMLYGQTPAVSVERRFADAEDDTARVASEMLERLLNTDIEKADDTYARALKYVLDDRLLPGFGLARVRYVAEFEAVPETPAKLDEEGRELAPAVPASESKTYECVETDYVHWKDVLWSPGARVWHEVRWLAFRAQLSREELVKRFGDNVGNAVPLNTKKAEGADEAQKADPWGRADVWEVWSKEHRRVFWYVEGHPVVLDSKEDPYELDGFWPCPEPMLANVTTSTLVPRPDFVLAQDLYDEVDTVSTRITLLVRAMRAAGVYNKSAHGVAQLLNDNASGNALYPVDNWAMFAEKGGIRGQVDWLPLEQIVATLTGLREHRRELMDALYQVTGMSDILRGQAATAGSSATENAIKARFGSVRIQALQDEFARFASDIQRLKAELVSKHFSPETILECSNVMRTPDAQQAEGAVALLKSQFAAYRVVVKPESVSLQDFAALKQERLEVLQGISTFLTAAAPLMAQPKAVPPLLKMLQCLVAGMRGSSALEAVLDQAVAAAEAAAQAPQAPQQPDTKLLTQQMKGAQDQQKIQAELQADLVRTRAEVEADAQREQNQAMWNTREAMVKHQLAAETRAMQPQPKPKGPGGAP